MQVFDWTSDKKQCNIFLIFKNEILIKDKVEALVVNLKFKTLMKNVKTKRKNVKK